MLVLKLFTLLFTINTERIKSLCMKRQLLLHTKRWLPLGMKRQSPMYMKRWSPLPPGSTVLIASTSIVNHLNIDHWSAPQINRGNCLFTWKWKLTFDPLWGNCWSPGSTEVITFSCRSESSLLILSEVIVDPSSPPLPQDQQRWLPFHTKVKVDCSSSLRHSSIPPGDSQILSKRWEVPRHALLHRGHSLSESPINRILSM